MMSNLNVTEALTQKELIELISEYRLEHKKTIREALTMFSEGAGVKAALSLQLANKKCAGAVAGIEAHPVWKKHVGGDNTLAVLDAASHNQNRMENKAAQNETAPRSRGPR
jgi:hypothetical protein